MLDENQEAHVLGQLAIMYVAYGRPDPGPAVLTMLLEDIEAFGHAVIVQALKRLRASYDGRAPITSKLLISACEKVVGRLDGEEAWALALLARNEADTVVWTDEIEQAWFAAAPLLQGRPDLVGGRKAFLAAYESVTARSREAGQLPKLRVSMGSCKDLRAVAMERAARQGLPVADMAHADATVLALTHDPVLALPAPDEKPPTPEQRQMLAERFATLKQVLLDAPVAREQAQLLQAQQERERMAALRSKAAADVLRFNARTQATTDAQKNMRTQ